MIKDFFTIISDNISNFPRIMSMSRINLKKQNRGADLGWLWSLAKPVIYIVMFYFAISLGFRQAKDIDGIVCPYLIWIAAGFSAWFYIQDMIIGGANCFKKNKSLIKNSTFPVTIIPAVNALTGIYIHLCMVGIILVLAAVVGVKPNLCWLQIPFYTVLMLIMTYFWSLATGLLAIVSKDFVDLLKAVKPAFFWLSGILFNSRASGPRIVFVLNPITYLVEGYRNCVCYNMWFWQDPVGLACFLGVLLVMALVSLLLYRRLRKQLPEII